MDCPRCDGPLATFALDGAEAVRCEACGYVGVEADHRPVKRRADETWAEAIARFRRRR